MTENPYQTPETVGKAAANGGPSRTPFAWFGVLVIAAIVEGAVAFRCFEGKPPGRIVTVLFFATPMVAILYSAFFALSYSGSLSPRKSVGQLLGAAVLAIVISAAGYVCFATTCCCTNLVAGTAVLEGAPPVVWACFVGGVISAGTMVLSCVLVVAILRAIGRQINKAARPIVD